MEAVRTAEGHQIAIKVVRLRSDGSPFSAAGGESTVAVSSKGGSPSMPAEAPFGVVHLGEKFASSMIIANEGVASLERITVKIELQTSTQRSLLNDEQKSTPLSLEAGQSISLRTMHDIREIGVHVIICSVHYENPVTDERKFIRKFFKFNVINPLTLKTKVSELPEMLLLLEAQLQNVSGTNFILESVTFEPLSSVTGSSSDSMLTNASSSALSCSTIDVLLPDSADFVSLKGLSINNNDDSIAQYGEGRGTIALPPESIYQYVFVLHIPHPTNRLVPLALGRLDIKWRAEGGERGRLQTAVLTHSWTLGDDLNIIIKGCPSRAMLHAPFDLLFILQNGTNRSLTDVCIVWEIDGPESSGSSVSTSPPPFAPLGPKELHLGSLTALNSTRAEMRVIPLLGGLQKSIYFYVEYNGADKGEPKRRIPINFTVLIETTHILYNK